jgi:putative aminopeptidase FrvX
MAVPNLTTILKRILKQPTAPFHEYHVRAEIEALLTGCPHVKTRIDQFGNLLATYKKGRRKSAEDWILGAHMDHPGFVRTPGSTRRDEWDFLGGVPKTEVDSGILNGLRKAKGDIATWNFPVKISGGRIEAPACDDLVGCAIIVSVLWELASLDLDTTFHAAFTRAEEVGFLGAWHLAQNWPYPEQAIYVSIETSRPVNGSVMGGGPVVRVGDRLSVFDADAIEALMRTASEQGIRVQRRLLDAGACEATAVSACGRRGVGLSVPLGNYHNVDDEGRIAPEFVLMEDVKAMVDLLKAVVATRRNTLSLRPLEERVAMRMQEHAEHLTTANRLFTR